MWDNCRTAAALLAAGALAGTLTAAPAEARPAGEKAFDLQAHRGGLGLRVKSTLASFGNALQVGVSTLELDVQITEDGQAVVTHDRRVSGAKCTDTAPAAAGDREFPYVEHRPPASGLPVVAPAAGVHSTSCSTT